MSDSVKKQCHLVRLEVHGELKALQRLTTNCKSSDEVQQLLLDLRKLTKRVKEQIVKQLTEELDKVNDL